MTEEIELLQPIPTNHHLIITFWNGDRLTLPCIKGHYRYKTIIHHLKILVKEKNQG